MRRQKSSLLELVKEYVTQLEGSVDNDAQVLRKLRKLFALGRVPDRMDGHHDGVTLGLRTGDLEGKAAEHGNLLGGIWGKMVGPTCPWVGKSFAPMTASDRQQIGRGLAADVQVFRGTAAHRVRSRQRVSDVSPYRRWSRRLINRRTP